MNITELTQAFFDRLDDLRATTLSDVQAVYTVVPQPVQPEADSAFPYITIGPIIAEPDDTKTDNVVSALVDVHIWSRTQSALSWRALSDAVYDGLQLYDLPVPSANVIECRYDGMTEFADPEDGKTWHTVLTFRVLYFLT